MYLTIVPYERGKAALISGNVSAIANGPEVCTDVAFTPHPVGGPCGKSVDLIGLWFIAVEP